MLNRILEFCVIVAGSFAVLLTIRVIWIYIVWWHPIKRGRK